MAKAGILHLLCAFLLSALVLKCHCQERKVHIVYMGEKPPGEASQAYVHHSMLTNVLGSSSLAKEGLVYRYEGSFNGFAAKLTQEEAARVSRMEGVVSVFPNRILKLHTTRSWDFMGFTNDTLSPSVEGDVIVGLLDTGIWPEHESFSDVGFAPPPAKWKGKCTGANFTCNKKLIGARYYNVEKIFDKTDIISPRDAEGHGSHTSSTAAGVEVPGASYLGLAKGVARGGVRKARIAMYKVCWFYGCSSADILKAFDDAIADGVDIISVSLGADGLIDYFEDPIAIGSFHAMKHGILTSNSAGNSGPSPATVSNYAPWTLTVAASSIDRRFITRVVLGNGKVFTGVSVNTFDLHGTSYPLIWGGDAANYTIGMSSELASFCAGPLDSSKVAGKIVFCEGPTSGAEVLLANGMGTIIVDSSMSDVAFTFSLPLTQISTEDGQQVLQYIKTTENPTATILVSEEFKDVMAPIVVSFSSRGPNPLNPDILKPDITAPGVDILAAWSPVAPPSDSFTDHRHVMYNIISGTSMSCPHASGAAAYVKAAHPDWSPAAIKSALMTSAYIMDPSKHEDLEFSYGAGHINPVAAVNPGLVYDASEEDYINFLCKQGYNTTTLRLVTGDNSTCKTTKPGRAWDLNYPSFSLYVLDGHLINAVFTRTVTYVGPTTNASYKAYVEFEAPNISVEVHPKTLTFSSLGDKQLFTVIVTGPQISQQPIKSGAIVWVNENQAVRSPIVIYNYLPGAPYILFTDEITGSVNQKKPIFRGPSSMYEKSLITGHH